MSQAAAGARRAVFLDRDGVLNAPLIVNGMPHSPAHTGELRLMPGAVEGCHALRDAGYLLLVVSNQPNVARGTTSREAVDALNEQLRRLLPLDGVYVCPHDDADQCDCRKPAPGLLRRAAQEWNVDLPRSFMVGDRWKDVEAGTVAGCTTVFIDNNYAEKPPSTADATVANLAEAATWILRANGSSPEAQSDRPDIHTLRIKLFADGANAAAIADLARDPLISGFTTNPTLMRSAGITDYETFAREILQIVPDRPVSFEVFDDDFTEMERQALKIAAWGDNVYVKIPVTDTQATSAERLIRRLAERGVQLNVTALLTLDQVATVKSALAGGPSAFVSVFAGRIADTGRDPAPLMAEAVRTLADEPQQELIWASPREVLNIFQADATGCHIITVTVDLLKKFHLIGRDLTEVSLDTVKMFHGDAKAAGYQL
jgi:transaldolase